jgi:hypothetical protein
MHDAKLQKLSINPVVSITNGKHAKTLARLNLV